MRGALNWSMQGKDPEKKKVAIYVRVSTDKQEVENQERQLLPFCKRSGWEVHKIYRDVMSGKEESRPGFVRMFKDAHKKLFDIVLFWDMSRFSRAGMEFTIQKLSELRNLGILWHSYQEQFLSTADPFTRDIILAVFTSVAKMEREKISQRTMAGLARAKARGTKLGRRSVITDGQIQRVWEELEHEGTISRAAKVAPFSKGTVYFIIKHSIHSREEYLYVRSQMKRGS
jgi:DNA invertase Pin-like site-specific DNA recombinase